MRSCDSWEIHASGRRFTTTASFETCWLATSRSDSTKSLSSATGRASKSLATVAGDDDRSRAYVETRRRGEVFVNGCAVIGEQVFARDGAVHFIDCVLD